MTRMFVPFDALWSMKIDVPYSFLVRDGGLAWSCGQLAMDRDSNVVGPGDLVRQSAIICDYIESILTRAQLTAPAIKRIYLYYVHSSDDDRAAMLATFRQRLGNALLLDPIPVPHFYYDGVVLEVDVFCADKDGVVETIVAGGVALNTISANGLTWLTVSSSLESLAKVADHMRGALRIDDDTVLPVLCEQWFAPTPMMSEASELLSASRPSGIAGSIVDAGPAGDQVYGLMTLVADEYSTQYESQVESGGTEVLVRQCGAFAWIQARCPLSALSLVEQTRRLMPCIQHELVKLGLSFQSVVKSTTHYIGSSSAEDLHDNMSVRNACYKKPGPASTGVPVFGFSADCCKIVVDVTAIAESH